MHLLRTFRTVSQDAFSEAERPAATFSETQRHLAARANPYRNLGGFLRENRRLRCHAMGKKRSLRGWMGWPLCATLVLLVAFAAAAQTGLGEPAALDYDEGVYLATARLLEEGYTLFDPVFSSQPPGFPETLALAFGLFGDNVLVGREVAVASSVVALGAVGWIGGRLAGLPTAPAAVLCLALPLAFFRQSQIAMPDMPALALSLLAAAVLLPTRGPATLARCALGGLLFAFALLCKLLVAPMALPLLLLIVLAEDGDGRWWVRVRGALSRLFAFGLASGICIFLVVSAYDLHSAYDQVVAFHTAAREAYGLDALSNLRFVWDQLARDATDLGLVVLAALGLPLLLVRNPLAAGFLCLWGFAAGLFLALYAPVFDHHVILLLPPVALAAACGLRLGVHLLAARGRRGFRGKTFVLAALVPLACWGLAWSVERNLANVPHYRDDPAPKEAIALIKLIRAHTEPGDLVAGDAQMQIFAAGRGTPPNLVDTSRARIDTGYLTDEEAIAASENVRMVVFQTERLERLPRYEEWVRSNFRPVDGAEGAYLRN